MPGNQLIKISNTEHNVLDFVRDMEGKSASYKTILFLFISVLLLGRLILFITSEIYPRFMEILVASPRIWVYSLLHFDTLVYIGLTSFVLLVGILFVKAPMTKGQPQGIFTPIALLTFSATFLSSLIFLLVLPVALSSKPAGFENLYLADIKMLLPQGEYVGYTFLISIALGLSVTDGFAIRGKVRWWSLLFPFFNFPILWWNTLAGWLPNRLWVIWKPILAICTLMMPVLVFPIVPSQLTGLEAGFVEYPQAGNAPREKIYSKIAFHLQPSLDQNKLYMNACHNLCRVDFDDKQWKLHSCHKVPFSYDEAAYDFKRGLIYLFDGQHAVLNVLDLETLNSEKKVSIPYNVFPVSSQGIHQAYLPQSDILVIGENRGHVVCLSGEDFSVLQSKYLHWDYGDIWRIIADEKHDELIVLQKQGITIYDPKTLRPLRSAKLMRDSIDCSYDPINDDIYISFPWELTVAQLDRSTLEVKQLIDAPMGVRPTAVDPDNHLLFMGSFSGILSAFDLDSNEPYARLRIDPWSRRLQPLPKHKKLIVSSGVTGPVSLDYLPFNIPFDPFDKLMQLMEGGIKAYFNNTNRDDPMEIVRYYLADNYGIGGNKGQSKAPQKSKTFVKTRPVDQWMDPLAIYYASEKILIIGEPRHKDLLTGLLEWAGYNLILADGQRSLSEINEDISLVIGPDDGSLKKGSPKRVTLEQALPNAQFIFSGEFVPDSDRDLLPPAFQFQQVLEFIREKINQPE